MAEARWCVEDATTGMPVAQGSAPTAEAASGEATRYAIQYAQDHPVRYWVRQNRKTVLSGEMSIVSFVGSFSIPSQGTEPTTP